MEDKVPKEISELHSQLISKKDTSETSAPGNPKSRRKDFLIALMLFAIAFTVRLYFIYFVSDPDNPGAGWFGDAYHHWQIAYLTKEIGLGEGFLRLWDLKGMEYFWGLLHPLLTIVAFMLTGSVSVGVERAMTAFAGSISVSLIYLLVSKHFNRQAGFAAALFAGLNAVGVFNDGTGMVEPIGIPFLLLGLYFWSEKPLFSGVFFMIALMARAEYWIFSLGLILAMVFVSKRVKGDQKALLILGFGIPLLIYMKYLLDRTGNPIYPFYYNYLTNIYGTWQLKPVLEPLDLAARLIFRIIFILTVLSTSFVVWKKPKGMFIYLLGIGNWMFLAASFGLGQYIKSYANYVWYVRFMILPYAFVGIVISIILFYYLPKIKIIKIIDTLKVNWLILVLLIAATQIAWVFIMAKYNTTHAAWDYAQKAATSIKSGYHGGSMLFLEGNPEITYALVVKEGFEGKNIISQMYDPYFYMSGDPYEDWDDNREIVLNWIKKSNIRTIVTYTQYDRYEKLAKYEPEYVSFDFSVPSSNIVIYQIHDKLFETEI